MTSTHALACRNAYQRKQQRRITDPLDDATRDAVVLQAALDGCDYEGVQERLDQARAAADGLVIEDGICVRGWAY